MIYLIYGVVAVAVFLAGQRYGVCVEKSAITVTAAAFTKAKALLASAITKAQAEAKAEVERVEALAKKYL
jgi:hypothetical protein